MELKEAIAILKAKRILFEDLKVVYRAIDTVLAELNRLNLENRKLKSIIEDVTGIENADEEVWDE
jgi:regulator of replication initiation timing